MQFSIAPWWVFAQRDTRENESVRKCKGVSRLLSPTNLIGKKGKRERKTGAGAMRARIMRGRARVRVEGLKRGKDGRGGGSGLPRRAGLVF